MRNKILKLASAILMAGFLCSSAFAKAENTVTVVGYPADNPLPYLTYVTTVFCADNSYYRKDLATLSLYNPTLTFPMSQIPTPPQGCTSFQLEGLVKSPDNTAGTHFTCPAKSSSQNIQFFVDGRNSIPTCRTN